MPLSTTEGDPQVFVVAPVGEQVQVLRQALAGAGYVAVSADFTPHPNHTDAEFTRLELARSKALIAIAPAEGEGTQVLATVEMAIRRQVPVLVVLKSSSMGVPPWMSRFVTVRSDLVRVDHLIDSLGALIANSSFLSHGDTTAEPALSATEDWPNRLRNSFDEERLARTTAMLLSAVGVELAPPNETGPDFVGWCQPLAKFIGNPFLIEIKRNADTSWNHLERAESWISRGGAQTLLVLVGSEFAEPSIHLTSSGNTILTLPVVELASTWTSRSLSDGMAEIFERFGVSP